MNDLYFIDYEPKVMLVDTVGMRPDTELAHRRLCDVIWATDEAPLDDDETLPDICRARLVDWVRIKGELRLKGWASESGRFVHRGTIKTRDRCKEKHARKSAAGKAGSHGRWGDDEGDAPEIPTLKEAIAMTMTAGIPDDFVTYVYEDWAGRAGKDAGGVVVRWLGYVTKRWSREQVEWKGKTHKGNKSNANSGSIDQKRINRNAGTSNESNTNEYEGLGRVVKTKHA